MSAFKWILVVVATLAVGAAGGVGVAMLATGDPCEELETYCARGQAALDVRRMTACTYTWVLLRERDPAKCRKVLDVLEGR